MSSVVFEQVRQEVAGALARDPASLSETDRLVADLGAESLDLVDLTFRLEKVFQLQIPEGDLFEAAPSQVSSLSLRDVADYVENGWEPALESAHGEPSGS
ncbi:MAG: acyl carrier protein [Blastochloris sp.]|nr:acyl carrier protein [Blastochloris sp.]